MTREEAIDRLEDCFEANIWYTPEHGITFRHKWVQAYEMALSALREKEEQSEKCKVCNGSKYSKPSPLKRLDRETGEWVYMGSFPGSCPVCGRRLEEV